MSEAKGGGGVFRARAMGVHLLTASGVLIAFAAAAEVCADEPDPRRVFLLLGAAVIVDAVDGPLARRYGVKEHAADVDGRKLDDIVDFLTFTFVPLLLVWRLRWVPAPAALWLAPALLASLFGFANVAAKEEDEGFFRGFPSYWNVYAFYAGLWYQHFGPLGPGLVVVALAALTVAPVRFVYPNLAPAGWRGAFIGGAYAWTAVLLALIPGYPRSPLLLVLASLIYPAFYVVASVVLDRQARARDRRR